MDIQRRNFLRGRFRAPRNAILPPWLKEPARFYEDCSLCARCLPACPQRILIQGDGGYPQIDFRLGECTFCGACTRDCPEALFTEASSRPPWNYTAQIGESCLALHGITCQSCQDNCESRAIRFVPRQSNVPKPVLESAACTACGACVAVCPASSITVLERPCTEEMSHV